LRLQRTTFDDELKARRKVFEIEIKQKEKTLEEKFEEKLRDIKEHAEALKSFEAKVTSLEDKYKEFPELRSAIEQQLKEVRDSVHQSLAQVQEKLSGSISEMDNKISTIERRQDSSNAPSVQAPAVDHTKLTALEGHVSQNTQNYTELSKRFQELENKSSQFEKIDQRMSELEKSHTNKQNSPDLSSSVNAIEMKCNVLQALVNSLAEKTGSIPKKYEDLEARLDQVASKMASADKFEENLRMLEQVSLEFQNNFKLMEGQGPPKSGSDPSLSSDEMKQLRAEVDERFRQLDEQRNNDHMTLEDGFQSQKNELIVQVEVGRSKFEAEMRQELRSLENRAGKLALQLDDKLNKKYAEIISTIEEKIKTTPTHVPEDTTPDSELRKYQRRQTPRSASSDEGKDSCHDVIIRGKGFTPSSKG